MTGTATPIDQLIAQLTVEEKAASCSAATSGTPPPSSGSASPPIMVADGPHGLRDAAGRGATTSASAAACPATCFPTASALGVVVGPRRWSREVGAALGRRGARAGRRRCVLGPGINIKRSPLCGRNFEYLSEDPLPRRRARPPRSCAAIQSQGVGTSLKHYAANNQEDDRLRVSAEVDERTLREIYLPAFERVVTAAQPWTVMCAYNKVNGIYASEHHWLLTEVLRDEWGFDGLVVSDWGAVHDRVAALRRRARPRDAAGARAAATRPSSTAVGVGRARRGRARHRPYAGCCGWSSRPGPRWPRPRPLRRTTRTTRWPAGPPPSRPCCCKNDGGAAAAAPADRRARSP